MDQKEALRQEIEQTLRNMGRQLEHIKEITGEATGDDVLEIDVEKAMNTIAKLMVKFNYTKG